MAFQRFRIFIISTALTLIVVLFQNCGTMNAPQESQYSVNVTPATSPTPVALSGCTNCVYTQMTWETKGGGDLGYTLSLLPNGGGFSIQVYRYNFSARNTTLTLSTNQNQTLVTEVYAVLQGNSKVVSRSVYGYTGSFSSVALITSGGAQTLIQSPAVESGTDPFNPLYTWVTSQLH